MKRRLICTIVLLAMLIFSVLAISACDSEDDSSVCHHSWVEATCTTPKSCSICKITHGTALGHAFVPANCTTPKTCSACLVTEGEALGHTWVDADCVTPKTCSVCAETGGEALGHIWVDADCVTPKTCSVCAETEGEALGHTWVDADCVTPKTCSVCAETEGEALGHTWVDADCVTPKTCSVCTATEGEALGHTWIDADCVTAKTCSVCATTEGEALGHDYSETISTEASCVNVGIKSFSCSRCNDTYTEEFTLPTFSATEIHDMMENSVGEIVTYDKSGNGLALGTCFVYSSNGKIITNYHVIEGAYSAEISIAGNTYTVQQVLAYDKDVDIAVLKINAYDLIEVVLCEYEHEIGSTVYAFGSSKGLTATFSQGIITSNRALDGVIYVQHDAAISSGNSGGPLINEHGEIIGINTMTMKDSQNLNFAITISELYNLVYGTPLSMSEFYEKECDVYEWLKNYIIANGTYNSKYNWYKLNIDTYSSVSSDTDYTWEITYFIDSNNIGLGFVIDDYEDSIWHMINIFLDGNIDGYYRWYYNNSEQDEMSGMIDGNTFNEDSTLTYTNHNISSSSKRASIRDLSSFMVDWMMDEVSTFLNRFGHSAKDFGFIHY